MMIQNKKFLIGILIIGLIGGSGLFVLYILGIIPRRPGPPILGTVSISTDKTEYEQGEGITITIKNTLDKSIWYNRETCPPFCVSLQKLENDQWTDVHMAIKVVSDLPVRPSSLEPYKEISREWDMFVVKPVDQIITAESGKYRFSFYYGLSRDKYTEKTIYSNEFTIKEKFTSKNCNSYEPPMTPEEIGECTCPTGYVKFGGLDWVYCATDSQTPCRSPEECPSEERCISENGERWFCSGRRTGCYFWSPESKEKICAD